MSCTSAPNQPQSIVPLTPVPIAGNTQPSTSNGVNMLFQYTPGTTSCGTTDGIAIGLTGASSATPIGWLTLFNTGYTFITGPTWTQSAATTSPTTYSGGGTLVSTTQSAPFYGWISITPSPSPSTSASNAIITVGTGSQFGNNTLLTYTPSPALPYTSINNVIFGNNVAGWTYWTVAWITTQAAGSTCNVSGQATSSSSVAIPSPTDSLLTFNVVAQSPTSGTLANCPYAANMTFYNSSGSPLYNVVIGYNSSPNTIAWQALPANSGTPNAYTTATINGIIPIFNNTPPTAGATQPMYMAFLSNSIVIGVGSSYSSPPTRLLSLTLPNQNQIASVNVPPYGPGTTAYYITLTGIGQRPSDRSEFYKALPWLIGGIILAIIIIGGLAYYKREQHKNSALVRQTITTQSVGSPALLTTRS